MLGLYAAVARVWEMSPMCDDLAAEERRDGGKSIGLYFSEIPSRPVRFSKVPKATMPVIGYVLKKELMS